MPIEIPSPGNSLPHRDEDDEYRVKAFVEVDLNISVPRTPLQFWGLWSHMYGNPTSDPSVAGGAPSVVHGGVNGPRDHYVGGGHGDPVSTPHLRRIDVVSPSFIHYCSVLQC